MQARRGGRADKRGRRGSVYASPTPIVDKVGWKISMDPEISPGDPKKHCAWQQSYQWQTDKDRTVTYGCVSCTESIDILPETIEQLKN